MSSPGNGRGTAGGRRGGGSHPKVSYYYVAVGTADKKRAALIDLFSMCVASRQTTAAIVCSSRDTLDELVRAFSEGICVAHRCKCCFLHSDMASEWRRSVIEDFASPGDGDASRVLICTDVCLCDGDVSLGVPLLINYDIPVRREQHVKRTSCLAERQCQGSPEHPPGVGDPSSDQSSKEKRSGCLVINFITANEVSALNSLESFASSKIEEVPLNLSDILQDDW